MENSKLERINELARLAKERALTAEELAERERLERLYEETRQIADRRAWDETSRTMAYNCGQEANDGQ